MRGKDWLFAVLLCLLSWVLPCAAAAEGQHIRVVLDTSQSMAHTTTAPQGNDPARLAKLSALLLYDLAQPNLTKGDTFRVIPFKTHWPPPSPGGAEPTGVGQALEPDKPTSSGDTKRARGVLASGLKKLAYDADYTYFAPGLDAAASELANVDCVANKCLVVLLTDGLPEEPTRDRDARRLRDDILPRLRKVGAALYVLAFGPDIMDSKKGAKDFLDKVLGTGTPTPMGQLFIDPRGDDLPQSMVRIFSEIFGYAYEGPKELSAPLGFVLADTDDNQNAAVVVFDLDKTPPYWKLGAPPGSHHTAQQWEGDELDASYSMQWIQRPEIKATYRIEPGSGRKPSAMVLRPASLEIEIRPRPPATKLLALGGRKFPIEILVRPSYGSGAPSGITIEYNETGEEVRDGGAWTKFNWTSAIKSPQSTGQSSPQGLVFPVDVNFDAPVKDQASYKGHLEIRALRGPATVADRRREKALEIDVYPPVRIVPTPDHVQISPAALEKKQRGCARFRLSVDSRQPLPHPANPQYKIAAHIGNLAPSGALDGATFTLDGEVLAVEGTPGATTNKWYLGDERTAANVFEPHDLEICVIAGKPSADAQIDLPIVFSLAEAPYDQVPDVFLPLQVKATFVAPSAAAKWGVFAALLGAPLLLLLSIYYLRRKPGLPSDLRVAVGPSGGDLTVQDLGDSSLGRRLLGLVPEKPVVSPDGSDILGWVRPVDVDLYVFRPAQGIVDATDPAERPEPLPPGERGARVRVHRRYQVSLDGRRYDFRLEYKR